MKEKIKVKSYVGKVIFNEQVYDVDDFEEVYRDEFDEDSPKEVYGAKKAYTINLDLEDELYNRACYNGYEEMEEMLDLSSELLKEAQRLVDKWVEEQGESASSWEEDKNIIVDLTDLFEECLNEK